MSRLLCKLDGLLSSLLLLFQFSLHLGVVRHSGWLSLVLAIRSPVFGILPGELDLAAHRRLPQTLSLDLLLLRNSLRVGCRVLRRA